MLESEFPLNQSIKFDKVLNLFWNASNSNHSLKLHDDNNKSFSFVIEKNFTNVTINFGEKIPKEDFETQDIFDLKDINFERGKCTMNKTTGKYDFNKTGL